MNKLLICSSNVKENLMGATITHNKEVFLFEDPLFVKRRNIWTISPLLYKKSEETTSVLVLSVPTWHRFVATM